MLYSSITPSNYAAGALAPAQEKTNTLQKL